MSLLPVGMGSSGNYQIANSLRLRRSASAYLSRTFGTPTSNILWTWSCWFKRGQLGSGQRFFGRGTDASGANQTAFTIGAGNNIDFFVGDGAGATLAYLATTQLFRDPSAWYNVQFVYDSANATANNRMRMYINGVEVTAFTSRTNPSASMTTQWNVASVQHNIGVLPTSPSDYFDGYLSEVNFIDGQALTPASFGETDASTGSWVAKKYTGTYGTNGFYLPFNDASNLTNLCLDRSGNANNWTATNVSLTAGATYDAMVDTPTNNYCTWNPLFPASLSTGTYTVSDANLKVADAATSNGGVQGTVSMDSGKWYWEVLCQSSGGSFGLLGIEQARPASGYPGGAAGVGYVYQTDGQKGNGAVFSAYGASYTTNDVVGVAFDAGSGQLTFYKNGVTQGLAYTAAAGTYFPAVGDAQNSTQYQWAGNFGQRPFTYTPPTGFKALHTGNLPAPAIANPKLHFDVVTRVGTAATANITGYQFAPDFVWSKSRGRAVDHALFDSVRGVQKMLESNQTGAEATEATGLTVFNSDGYTIGALDQINGTTATNSFVDWAWKAGGAAVTNTAGSISAQVSANAAAGFSIVTYTGTGANATVGHGLGVAPAMVIVKNRTGAADNWPTYHKTLGNTQAVRLNTTAAAATSGWWNNTTPTSSVFALGSIGGGASESNTSGNTYVAYCFAEIAGFSRIGSYTGNGLADGPFVWCGFRPRWVMIKRSDSTGNWGLYDTSRSPINAAVSYLAANVADAEVTNTNLPVDILSNGFKLRDAIGGWNASAGTYIFIAFAEAPFQTANAR